MTSKKCPLILWRLALSVFITAVRRNLKSIGCITWNFLRITISTSIISLLSSPFGANHIEYYLTYLPPFAGSPSRPFFCLSVRKTRLPSAVSSLESNQPIPAFRYRLIFCNSTEEGSVPFRFISVLWLQWRKDN